ncbi:MAG: efflux RND transporter periplasmic adaptor subunit [Sulfuricellaceae bacterium]|nr:efflux RND transporter periplasmic adaptor subunit [Sulfuricellaceae bacterium]
MTSPFRFWHLIVLVLIALVSSGLWYVLRTKPVSVTVYTVSKGVVEASVANTRAGTVKACRRARLAPPAGGQIAHLLVKKGDRVQAGQALLSLWNDDFSAQLALAGKQIQGVQANIRQACAIAGQAEREAERTRQLKNKGFVSEARLDQVASEAQSRRAACEVAQAELGPAKERIALARAGVTRTQLNAPFAGIVAEITGELGEYATPSPPGIPTPPAIDLIDDSCLYVSAPIDEVDAPHIKPGMTGRITLDALAAKHFSGKVRRIAPYVLDLEKQARTVEVELDFNDPADTKDLLVGYSADVEIVYQSRPDVLRIPTAAIQEGNRVLLLVQGGKLEARTLQIGLANWDYSEVSAGLHEGDQIVTSLDREGVAVGSTVIAEQK